MQEFFRKIQQNTSLGLDEATKLFAEKTQPIAKQALEATTTGLGAIGASLSEFADIPFDYDQVTRIVGAARRNGLETIDLANALPPELSKYGTDVVDQFLKTL